MRNLNPAALVDELRKMGVKLTPAGDKLRIEALVGVLTPELKEAVAKHKTELLQLLSSEQHTAVIPPANSVVRIYPRPRRCVEKGACAALLCDWYPYKPGWCRERIKMR